MTDEELIKRAADLAGQCEKRGRISHSAFLTPAEGYAMEQWAGRGTDCRMLLHGGYSGAERRVAFFLPDWLEAEDFDPSEYLCAVEATARFGSPGHRDYLGAALGLGIERPWLGDILVEGERAYLLCLPSVKGHLLLNLEQVGRWGVKTREIPLSELPDTEKEYKERTFSVKSLRLDAVCAGMFSLSRTSAAEAIAAGLVAHNYAECLKPDAPVRAGDVISLRGKGKGSVRSAGDRESKKGRLFVTVEIAI